MNYSTTWQAENLDRGGWQRGSTQKVIRRASLPIEARSIESDVSPLIEVRKSNLIFGAVLFFALGLILKDVRQKMELKLILEV